MKTLFRNLLVVGVASVSLLPCVSAVAEDTVTEIERRNLISLARQLDQLHALADNAQSASNPQARVKFNYDQLHRDIDQMRQAIARHLEKPSRSPRVVAPATRDYSE